MDFFGYALLLGYLLGLAHLITKDIPKKKLKEDNSSSISIDEEDCLKIEEILREQASRDFIESVMNASFEQYFVAAVLSAMIIWFLYHILANFFFLLSTLR